MDLGGHEGAGEMPMPITSNYSALHESAKLKMLTSGNGTGADDMNANNSGVPPQLLRPLPTVQPPIMDNSSSTPKALVALPVGPSGPVVTGLVGGGATPGNTASATPTGPGAVTPGGTKKAVRYRECHKNHAASIGGHAIDGCGEFMPSGEEGTVEALKCAACDCHRNFHRREVEGEPSCDCHLRGLQGAVKDRKRSNSVGPVGSGGGPSPGMGTVPLALPSSLVMPSRAPTPILMALSSGAADSDDQEQGLGSASPAAMKKRFRTKFSTEQKEKMCSFADKLGWKIQKHDEAAVQQFCSDVGVKRHVLKVWMHNNKHTLGKKILDVPTPQQQQHQLVVAGPA